MVTKIDWPRLMEALQHCAYSPVVLPRQVHLFDGYGMIAKFTIADGKVSVSNRCVHVSSAEIGTLNSVLTADGT